MLCSHVSLHAVTGYKPAEITRCPELGKRFGPAAGKRVVKVKWQQKEEPADNDTIPKELIEDYQARREALGHIRLGKDACCRKDEHKTNLQRQGYWTPLQDKVTPALLHQPGLRSCININSSDVINPDHDIAAPGKYIIRIRDADATQGQGRLAYIYSPAGKTCGTILPARLLLLQTAFEHTKHCNSSLHEKYHNPSFEHAVVSLLSRYNDKGKHSTQSNMQQHWSTPDAYMKAMKEGLQLSTERFASPLNFSPHLTSYYSLQEEDQLFGANYDTYSTKWTGASQARPEYESAAMDKAVRWAIASCEDTAEPVLTVFVLPWQTQKSTAYAKWLCHPSVQEIKTVKRGNIALVHPLHWSTGKTHTATAKWDIKFFVVANEAGLKQYYREYSLEMGFREAASRVEGYNRVKRLDTHRQRQTANPLNGLHAPSRFAKVKFTAPRHWREAATETGTSLPAEMQSPVELKHVAEDIIYTDGSRREFPNAGIVKGGGVFRKATHAPIQLTVRTNTAGENNTINRAEVASIYVALQECRPDHDEVIATDSKLKNILKLF